MKWNQAQICSKAFLSSRESYFIQYSVQILPHWKMLMPYEQQCFLQCCKTVFNVLEVICIKTYVRTSMIKIVSLQLSESSNAEIVFLLKWSEIKPKSAQKLFSLLDKAVSFSIQCKSCQTETSLCLMKYNVFCNAVRQFLMC